MECIVDHFLVWQRTPEAENGKVSAFRSAAEFDSLRLNHLLNRLDNAKFWPLNAAQARTINPIARTMYTGQWTDSSKFVCGYFVVKGNLERVIDLSQQIDRSFAEPFIGKLSPEALDDFTAHATGTYMAVRGIEATVMLVWANNYAGEPRMPTDLAIGAITAYNAWGRRLAAEGLLLDAGRMNVRHDASHLANNALVAGPFGGARLMGIGSYGRNGKLPVEALQGSGILADPDVVVGLQRCNGWCSALSTQSPVYDNPKNSIFV